ncbi:outer membrane beta-barrel protein [Algibacter lectus]|uniref:outer membrane beta-barrel protein n=1 Tax=Algibacter lectus TaxID=221126 RepID=UPI0026F375EF|nr:outer membrane beta-barrel protein [Algibacter lectus]MDO7136016.1 outer membrane beta-barrel protein [Algibacter lectus]
MTINRFYYLNILSVFCSLVSNVIIGQNIEPIIGKVVNLQKEPLEFVSVTLLNPKDSTFVNYSITDIKGDFKIFEGSKDSLIVQLSSVGYLPYFKNIAYKKQPIDLRTIVLEEDITSLDEVTISVAVPIQIKKDTIAFNASSFKVKPDDNIEGLLKKLPGVEVDSDGKVVAQGNEVTKIFVDGKEFFGGDPSIVLKNLSADAISKIEVIDKKSDEAALTGVDDGNKEVVINFTLKKTKKNNGFGKLSGGMGLDSRYFSNVNYNKFSSKTQLSIIGKVNNINVTGSNIQGFLENADGLADESDDDDSSNKQTKSLSGYLKTGVGGVNVGHEFKKKESLNADYFYNLSDNDGISKSQRVSFSNNNNYDYEAENTYSNTTKNHNLNINYENLSNKNYSLRIRGQLIADNRMSNSDRDASYVNDMGELATTNNQVYSNTNDKQSGNFNINYYHKLQKEGRSFNAGLKTNLSSTSRENEQNTIITRGFISGKISSREIFTLRDETFNNAQLNFNFRYTEPLGGSHYFRLDAYLNNKTGKEDIHQLKTTITNDNEEELLAFNYKNIERSYQTRFGHSFSNQKFNIYNGLELQDLNRTFGVVDEIALVKGQAYLNPISTILYKPKKGSKYRFSYKKTIRSPSSSQSSTVINDLNPYFIRKGNPNLKTEKLDIISLNTNIYNYASFVSIYSKIQYERAKDAIIESIDIDEDYIKTRSFQNSGNRMRFSSILSFSKKIKGLGLRYSIKNRNDYKTSNSIINLLVNEVVSRDYFLKFDVENYNKNVFDIKVGASCGLNNTSFSIEQDLDREYIRQQYFSNFDYDMSNKLNFNTQFDYIIFTDNKFESDQKLPLWNVAISYSFSKRKNNIVKLVFIDLLDKNIDIYKRSTANYFEETISESLGRYAILSYTYRLNSAKKKA